LCVGRLLLALIRLRGRMGTIVLWVLVFGWIGIAILANINNPRPARGALACQFLRYLILGLPLEASKSLRNFSSESI